MQQEYPHPLQDNPAELAGLGFWTSEVYKDLIAMESGTLNEGDFKVRYAKTAAILILDMTRFTETAMDRGELYSLLRIVNAQKVCAPVLKKYNATHVRAFADDITATFHDPRDALSAATVIHSRIKQYNLVNQDKRQAAECCIGIGYGEVYEIGLDKAMGDEMNRASKLGEDTAGAGETLVTERVYQVLNESNDYEFRHRIHEEIPFPFYEALYRQG